MKNRNSINSILKQFSKFFKFQNLSKLGLFFVISEMVIIVKKIILTKIFQNSSEFKIPKISKLIKNEKKIQSRSKLVKFEK